MNKTKIYICDDCTFVFQVYGKNNRRQFFCPSCGESVSVRRYKSERTTKGNTSTKIRWKDEELQLLNKCIKKEMEPYQVAILTGRSINSVVKKLNRIKKTNAS